MNRYKSKYLKNILQTVETRGPRYKGNAWDKITKQGGLKEALKKARESNITPWRLAKRLMNKGLWKYAFSTLGWNAMKQLFQFSKNQKVSSILMFDQSI